MDAESVHKTLKISNLATKNVIYTNEIYHDHVSLSALSFGKILGRNSEGGREYS